MPLYEYSCRSCGEPFEALVQGAERPACPKCGGHRLEKRLSGFAVGGGRRDAAPPPPGCGSCGDPRGPGSCRS